MTAHSISFTSALICFVALPFTALAQKDVKNALQETLPKGWECLQGPNELDRPGLTFFIDGHGVRYELADLSAQVHPESGQVAAVQTGTRGYISAGLLAKILGLGGILSVSASKSFTAAVSLSERQEFRTNEADTRAALRTLDAKLIDPKNTYYIIRNTQVAKQMRLTLDKSVAAAFGGDILFSKALDVSGAAKEPPDSPPAKGSPDSKENATQPADKSSAKPSEKSADKPASPASSAANTKKPDQAKPDKEPVSGSASVSISPGKQSSVSVNIASGGQSPDAKKPTSSEKPSATTPIKTAATPTSILVAQDSRTYTIDQTFDKPLTVCFLAQKFTLQSISSGAGGTIKDARLESGFWNPSANRQQ